MSLADDVRRLNKRLTDTATQIEGHAAGCTLGCADGDFDACQVGDRLVSDLDAMLTERNEAVDVISDGIDIARLCWHSRRYHHDPS